MAVIALLFTSGIDAALRTALAPIATDRLVLHMLGADFVQAASIT